MLIAYMYVLNSKYINYKVQSKYNTITYILKISYLENYIFLKKLITLLYLTII